MRVTVNIKRAYDPPLKKDGYRVFVDRLWPRGVSKKELPFDEWAKELAPTPPLRKWFGHDPLRWSQFQRRYLTELRRNNNIDTFVASHRSYPVITLLYAASDVAHNHALVLQAFLQEKFDEQS